LITDLFYFNSLLTYSSKIAVAADRLAVQPVDCPHKWGSP